MSVVVVIPARYASVRYPGKPLVELTGATGVSKSLIRRSWEAATAAHGIDAVHVATDDARIAEAARAFGASVLMTPESCRNGTERCAAALDQLPPDVEMVVNLQGDAPLTPPWFVEALVSTMRADPTAPVATPVLRCDGRAYAQFQEDRRAGRVGGTTAAFGENGDALYFSKEVIPFSSETYAPDAPTPVFHHVGLYAYRPDALRAYAAQEPTPLEKLEGLEQLRFLERGLHVRCVTVEAHGRVFWELNNPIDVARVESALRDAGVE